MKELWLCSYRNRLAVYYVSIDDHGMVAHCSIKKEQVDQKWFTPKPGDSYQAWKSRVKFRSERNGQTRKISDTNAPLTWMYWEPRIIHDGVTPSYYESLTKDFTRIG